MLDNDCAHYFNETDLSIRTSQPRMAIMNKYQMIDELSITQKTLLNKIDNIVPSDQLIQEQDQLQLEHHPMLWGFFLQNYQHL